MGNESRYDQYDLNITLPEPLVPRHLRLAVPERLDNEGNVLLPLDETAVRALLPVLRDAGRAEPRGRFPARLRQSAARAAGAEIVAGGTAGHAGVAVVRSLAGDARMGALFHHRRQRLCAAADGPLPARVGGRTARSGRRGAGVPDVVGRGADYDRDRVPLPGAPGGERAGGWRDLLGVDRPGMRAGERAVVRHGRHHGEDLPDRRLQAADRARRSKWRGSGGSAKARACRCGFR